MPQQRQGAVLEKGAVLDGGGMRSGDWSSWSRARRREKSSKAGLGAAAGSWGCCGVFVAP